MKHYIWKLLVVLSLSIPIFGSGTAFAAAPANESEQSPVPGQSVVQQLHVTATILPARHIITGLNGQILRIISNTSEDVTPTAYQWEDLPADQRPMTDALMQTYRQIVPAGSGHAGILYERDGRMQATQDSFPIPLQQITNKLYLAS